MQTDDVIQIPTVNYREKKIKTVAMITGKAHGKCKTCPHLTVLLD